MKAESTFSLGLIKKIGFVIIFAFVMLLVSFTILQSRSGKKEYEDRLIINIFGKQRMYTQMISKDANLLYTLMQAEENNSYQSKEDIISKIDETKGSLRKANQEFTTILTAMEEGYLFIDSYRIDIRKPINQATEDVAHIKEIWSGFNQAINILVDATEISKEVALAAIYINEHNLELLRLSEQLQQSVMENSIQSVKRLDFIGYTLISLLSVITVAALFHLMKFILLPFQQLYKGLSEIGLEHYPEKMYLPTKKRVVPMIDNINTMFLEIKNLISLIENMNNNSSFNESLDFINRTFSQFIPYNYIGIALFDDDKKMLKAAYGVSDGTITGMSDRIAGKAWLIHDTSLEHLIHTGEARIINDLEEYTSGKPLKLYNRIILEAGIRSSITLPLKVAGEPVGVIFFSSNQKNVYKEEHLKFLKTLVNSIAISFNQNIFIDDLVFSSILALAKLAEARDEDTGDHLDRMKIYSRVIAELLYKNNTYPGEITHDYFDKIERFSPLHDIGKVGVRDGILLKPAKLTPEEYEEMKKHALYGAEVLKSAEENITRRGRSLFGMGIEIAEGHHEKWDGSGYPYGRKGFEIPLSARIVAVADVFDALTSKRPYKKAFSFDSSVNIIEEGKGKHFDPNIVDIFLANKDRFEKLYQEFQLKAEVRSA